MVIALSESHCHVDAINNYPVEAPMKLTLPQQGHTPAFVQFTLVDSTSLCSVEELCDTLGLDVKVNTRILKMAEIDLPFKEMSETSESQ